MALKKIVIAIWFLLLSAVCLNAQTDNTPDFTWGNTVYFNLSIGESIRYLQKEITLLSVNNQCNTLKVDKDTVTIKISQYSLPVNIGGLRIYIADNKRLKFLTNNTTIHGLLKKDALVAVSILSHSLLNENNYVFPVNFNEGFIWNIGEDNHVFSLMQADNGAKKFRISNGIDFDLYNDNGTNNHWMVAIENSKVVWIKENNDDENHNYIDVLLESDSQPGIYYYYGNLYKRDIEVRERQKLIRGELIGTVSGEKKWGLVHFSVLRSDTIPDVKDVGSNVLNFFPQMFELYYNKSFNFSKLFSKGNIVFGQKNNTNGGDLNNLPFEEYAGKGWLLGCWNVFNKVPFAMKGDQGNIRLYKVLFKDTRAESVNPENYYDYEITVKNGTYRIRAKIGDVEMATWQKVEFENISAGEFSFAKAQYEWTPEKIVKVRDGSLTVRIYIDPENKMAAGISEIVFQQAL